MKIYSVGAELFRADRQTDGQTDMMKLIVAFHNFANAPKKCVLYQIVVFTVVHFDIMRGFIHGYGSVTLSSNYAMVISPVTDCQKYQTQCRQCHLLVSGLTLLWSPSDWQHSLHSPIYRTEASEHQSHQQPLLQY